MPIEIKEMHIKIVVGENGNPTQKNTTNDEDSNNKIVEACVEQVMEILTKKEER